MKVFLTGASGILGTDIAKNLQLAGYECIGFNSANIDLKSLPDIESKMHPYKPDVVIHSAALTNVDLCEDDKAAAYAINVTGSKNMAIAADKINARIIYISSCGVYGNGKLTPYHEQDVTAPLNYHHYTKLEGEKMVMEYNKNHMVIRPGWLFGGTTAHRKNFVEARRKEAQNATTLSSAIDKVGSPTYTSDLAEQILYLINQDVTGIYNAVNEGYASRYEYVSEIVKLFGYDTIVNPVNSNEFPRKANMPDNECLENRNLNMAGFNRMRDWKDALKDYITTTYNL
jgi:dTDP-4-dehydrorhamnose reductase